MTCDSGDGKQAFAGDEEKRGREGEEDENEDEEEEEVPPAFAEFGESMGECEGIGDCIGFGELLRGED